MEPPPAPTLCTSTAGDLNWKYPSWMSRLTGVSPSRHSDTSVDVPPISKVRMSGTPISRARYAEPVTPPDGPERAIWIGLLRHSLRAHGPAVGADDGERPAEPLLVDGCLEVPHVHAWCRGCTAVLTTVVSVRSYSPYSCPMSAEMETERSGWASRTMSLARRSCAGLT